jgi:hypothetical protein
VKAKLIKGSAISMFKAIVLTAQHLISYPVIGMFVINTNQPVMVLAVIVGDIQK